MPVLAGRANARGRKSRKVGWRVTRLPESGVLNSESRRRPPQGCATGSVNKTSASVALDPLARAGVVEREPRSAASQHTERDRC